VGGVTGISGITVQQYVNPDGSASGSVIDFSTPVYMANLNPLPTDTMVNGLELVGTSSFQFVLWKGSSAGVAGTTNRFGAALMGGLNLTDQTDAGTSFSFLQVYHDAANPNGTIDFAGAAGRVNSTVAPRFGGTPGWDFAGTQYDYFDVPYDLTGSPNETVSFETALVSYTANSVQILGDYTWSFTTGTNGNPQSFVTGLSVQEQTAASDTLLALYGAANPGIAYLQMAAAVPEPATPLLLALTLSCFLFRRRRQPPSP
jgi:hypothetical protein